MTAHWAAPAELAEELAVRQLRRWEARRARLIRAPGKKEALLKAVDHGK